MKLDPWCVFGSGSRDLRREHYPQILAALQKYSEPRGGVFIHGDGDGRNGSVGFDKLAAHAAEKLGLLVYGFPADWDRFNKRAGPIRNQLCARVLFAHAPAHYRLAFVSFPTGGPGTAGATEIVTKLRDASVYPVVFEKFQVTL